MKSIVCMQFILIAAVLVSSPAQGGYTDGMSKYAAYHVMHEGVDPHGLTAKVVTRPWVTNSLKQLSAYTLPVVLDIEYEVIKLGDECCVRITDIKWRAEINMPSMEVWNRNFDSDRQWEKFRKDWQGKGRSNAEWYASGPRIWSGTWEHEREHVRQLERVGPRALRIFSIDFRGGRAFKDIKHKEDGKFTVCFATKKEAEDQQKAFERVVAGTTEVRQAAETYVIDRFEKTYKPGKGFDDDDHGEDEAVSKEREWFNKYERYAPD